MLEQKKIREIENFLIELETQDLTDKQLQNNRLLLKRIPKNFERFKKMVKEGKFDIKEILLIQRELKELFKFRSQLELLRELEVESSVVESFKNNTLKDDDDEVGDVFCSAKIWETACGESFWKNSLFFSKVLRKEDEWQLFEYKQNICDALRELFEVKHLKYELYDSQMARLLPYCCWTEKHKKSFSKREMEKIERLFELFHMVRNVIWQSNLKLVDSNVTKKRHHKQTVERRLMNIFQSEEDYRSAAWKGLNRAIEKFDHNKNLKFSTYATGWINQSINDGINNNDADIRYPVNFQTRINNFNKELNDLKEEKEVGRQEINDFKNELSNKYNIPTSHKNWGNYATSLDLESDNEFLTKWEPSYEVDYTILLNESDDGEGLTDSLLSSLKLNPIETKIFKMRNGLFPFIKNSQKEITKILLLENVALEGIEKKIKTKINAFKKTHSGKRKTLCKRV